MWQFLAQNTQKICTYYTDQPNYFLICIVLHKEGIVEHVLFVGYILVIFLWPNSPRLFWTKVVAALKVNAVQIWSANNIAQFSSLCFFLPEFQWEKDYFLHWAFSSWISVRKTILPNICCAVNVLHSHNFRQSRVISSDWRNLIKSNLKRGKNIHCNILHSNNQMNECTMLRDKNIHKHITFQQSNVWMRKRWKHYISVIKCMNAQCNLF